MSSYYKSDLSFFARQRADGLTGFWWLADSETWAAAKTDLKTSFPHFTGLRYDGVEKEWTIPVHSLNRLQRWADAWSSRQEWDALPRRGERRQDHSRHAQDAPGEPASSPYRVLYLLPDAPLWAAEAVYRAAQKLAHPDVAGGDHAQAVSLNTAIEAIRAAQKCQARAS